MAITQEKIHQMILELPPLEKMKVLETWKSYARNLNKQNRKPIVDLIKELQETIPDKYFKKKKKSKGTKKKIKKT